MNSKKSQAGLRTISWLGAAASLLATACGGATGDVESVGEQSDAVVVTRRVTLQVYTVEAGFSAATMTQFVNNTNSIFAPTNIQFDFNPATNVSPNPVANCSDAAIDAFGDTVKGKVAIFYCPSRNGGEASFTHNRVMIGNGDNLAHELGHYFGLPHVHGEGWVPQTSDLTADQINRGFHSAESCIKPILDGTARPAFCPPGPTTGAGMRDTVFNGDGLADTAIGIHETTASQAPHQCEANFVLPLAVRRANGTVVNFDFTPLRNNPMGYFGCPGMQMVFSPSQINIMRNSLLTGIRAQLINKNLNVWSSAFSDGNGWANAAYYSTIRLADVNQDGRTDVCGRGSGGISCGLSNGSSFGAASVWNSSFSDANGWANVQYYSTIRFPNVNGSGGKDVCGRGGTGVFCATSTGSAFGAATNWASSFSDANGWNAEKYYATIDFPDVTGDAKADLCGRGGAGIVCGSSSGSAFAAPSTWNSAFSDANGWGVPQYYKTIKYPNVNGDTKSDVCGRGGTGIFCATSNGSSAFDGTANWAPDFSDANGWTAAKYYSTISFPDLNGDGKADVCGRGSAGLVCGISNGSSFTNVHLWSDAFSDANGWDTESHYGTLVYSDIDADGKVDVCGRGATGLYCAYSNGSGFDQLHIYANSVSDANGWTQPQYYKTFMFANIDSSADAPRELCARGSGGIICE